MNLEIKTFDNKEHRNEVIDIWTSIFGYKDPRNNPSLVIDNKLAVNDNLFFIAMENGKIVGTIMAGYDGHRGWIYSLAVIPEKRKTNIGTKLLKHTENELKKLVEQSVPVNVITSNGTELQVGFFLFVGFVFTSFVVSILVEKSRKKSDRCLKKR